GRCVDPVLVVPYERNFEPYHTFRELMGAPEVGSPAWRAARHTLGVRGARGLLRERPDVDGVVCFDDQLAFGVTRACAELGRRVPYDVSVVGCNDLPLASQVTPTLTTQRIPSFDMGVCATERLLARLERGEQAAPVVFDHQLVVRESAP